MSTFRELSEVVAPAVLRDAHLIGELLTRLRIPHALIGGLAVGLRGFPRATKDVDYMVGPEAFEMTTPFLVYRDELKDRVKMGVVDLLAVPDAYPCLADELGLPAPGTVHVIAPAALVLMKLSAGRAQDLADVSRLLAAGLDPDEVADYLVDNAPSLLVKFAQIFADRSR